MDPYYLLSVKSFFMLINSEFAKIPFRIFNAQANLHNFDSLIINIILKYKIIFWFQNTLFWDY